MEKPLNNRAWLMVAPVFVLVLFSALLPMMTVVNYSSRIPWGRTSSSGTATAGSAISSTRRPRSARAFSRRALSKNLSFSLVALAIEVPLGIAVALACREAVWAVGPLLVIIALPMLIPWNVVGTIWQISRAPTSACSAPALTGLGLHYNVTQNAISAWCTIVVIDVWHWTPLVILLTYAGLRAIPDAFYQAARIDAASRWATFFNIELPKLQKVLVIVVLLRFMQTFMIYTEPFVVTGGGPGSATTFLSIDLVKIALGQVDLGPRRRCRWSIT
jgi:glycerol transport system permease protein